MTVRSHKHIPDSVYLRRERSCVVPPAPPGRRLCPFQMLNQRMSSTNE
jgi:hypothetical protein